MPELSKWAKGKPIGLVMISQQVAVSAEACFEFLKLDKGGERIVGFSSIPNVWEWLRLYRNHRRIQRCVVENFRRLGGIAKEGADFAELIFFSLSDIKKVVKKIKKKIGKMSSYEWRKFASEAEKKVNQVYNFHLSDIQSDMIGKTDNDGLRLLRFSDFIR